MAIVEELSSWADYKTRMEDYASFQRERREQIIFRGQPNEPGKIWPLQPTLDRVGRKFMSDKERESFSRKLWLEFKRSLPAVPQAPTDKDISNQEWELLGRHHGLPSPWLDWTESPYVAAFFAYASRTIGDPVSIWMLDRRIFLDRDVKGLTVANDEELLRFNVKAVAQRSVFMRVEQGKKMVESLLDKYLVHFQLPGSEQEKALNDLDEMTINACTLSRDLHGAAGLAKYRVLGLC